MSKERKNIILMVIGIVAITGFPYLKEGLCAYFPDLMYHMLRTEGVKDALLAGDFPTRIYTNFYNGYGYGSPLFYPDIFLVMPAILRILSFSPLATWKIFALTLTVAATLTTYFSIKYICKDSEYSIAATFMIMLSQFFLADLHLRAGISEYMAFMFIPVLCAGIYDFFVYDGKKTYLMGIAFIGLLLSHSIMTFIGVLITVVIFIRMLFVKRENNYLFDKLRMTRLIITAICTVLVVLFYLLPMLEQMAVLELGYLEPWAHVGKYTQPISSFFSVIGHFSTIAYIGIGVPMLPLIIICLFLKGIKNKWAYAFLYGGIVLYLITTNIIPWRILENTVLNMIQFTYRFWPYAIIFTVFGIVMILSERIDDSRKKCKKIFIIAIVGCSMLAGAFQNRMTAWVTSEETRGITEEYLAENDNYVGAGEWLPLDISDDVINRNATKNVVTDTGEMILLDWNKGIYSFQISEEFKTYTLPLIFYKGYSASIECEDGSIKIIPIKQSADALVQIVNFTGEEGIVCVKYEGTIIQKVSLAISEGTIAVITVCYICKKRIQKTKE